MVYQIDLGVTRLLWIGKERTIESFQGFFTTMGEEITSTEALHILDRFHIVAKMNKALDQVRAGESRRRRAKAGHRS